MKHGRDGKRAAPAPRDNLDTTRQIADHLRRKGRFAEALPLFRYLVKRGDATAEVLEGLRYCCQRLEVAPASEFERLLELRPDYLDLRLHTLEEHRRNRHHGRIVELALAAPEPRPVALTLAAAEAAFHLGRAEEAEALFRRVLDAEPNDPQARRGLARLEGRARRFDRVLETLEEDDAEGAGPDLQSLTLAVSAQRRLGRTGEAAAAAARGLLALAEAGDSLAAARLADRFGLRQTGGVLRSAAVAGDGPDGRRMRRRAVGHLLGEGRVSDALILYRRHGGRWWQAEVTQSQRSEFERIARALGHDAPESWGHLADHGIVLPDEALRGLFRLAQWVRPYDAPARSALLVTGTLGAGGAERQLVRTALGLMQRPGRDGSVTVATLQDLRHNGNDQFVGDLQTGGVDVVQLHDAPDRGLPIQFAPAEPLLTLLRPNLAGPLTALCRLFAERRPAVVHGWQDVTGALGALAALLTGVPRIVIGTRSLAPDRKEGRNRPWLRMLMALVVGHPRVVLVNNSLAGRRDYARWLGVPVGRLRHLPNGYDFAAMTAEAPAAGPADGERIVIGGVMRMTEEKRPELWLDAVVELCRRDRRVRGLLVGDGPMRPGLEERLAASGMAGRIDLAGRRNDMWAQYAAMDLLLLTSRTEGLPNVLIEAQALGRPVAATPAGGSAETFVDGETGVLLDKDTPGAIADRIEPLVRDADMRYRFGERAAGFVRREFGQETMIRRTMAVYGWPFGDGDGA